MANASEIAPTVQGVDIWKHVLEVLCIHCLLEGYLENIISWIPKVDALSLRMVRIGVDFVVVSLVVSPI